jgi:hypothetical protein
VDRDVNQQGWKGEGGGAKGKVIDTLTMQYIQALAGVSRSISSAEPRLQSCETPLDALFTCWGGDRDRDS